MADRQVQLALEINADAARAAADVRDVGGAYVDMARDVDKASRVTKDAAARIDTAADASDTLASKSSQATGALGALASGMTLVGAEKYATQLETAALATDFFSGVGDALNLVMNATALTTLRATVASGAHAVATAAQSAVTKAAAAAQWAMNAALAANPIGLVVLAVIALVAALVLAYKKSETFRNIVQAVGRVGAQAIGFVVTKVGELVAWVRDRAPAAFNRMRDIAVAAFMFITTPQRALLTLIGNLVGLVRDRVPAAFAVFRDKLVAVGNAVLEPFRKLRDFIDSILDKIKKIKIPDLPDVPFFGRTSGVTTNGGGVFVGGDTINLRVDGGTNPQATALLAAREVEKVLQARDRRLGRFTA